MTHGVAENAVRNLAVKRVLFISLSVTGDVAFASPLIEVIKRSRPGAAVYWLAEFTVAPLFKHHAGLKELLMWPRGECWELFWQGRLSPLSRKVLGFRKKLRGHHFDLVLDVQWLLKSAVLRWMNGAQTRIGFPSKEPTGRSLTKRVPSNLGPTISS